MDMVGEDPKPTGKPGRKGEGPRGGKSAALTIRIRRETREALDAAAAQTGRLIGQVAELWLEQARNLNVVGSGRSGVAEAITAITDLAAQITEEIGDPGESHLAREAFIAGGRHLLEFALPFTPKGKDKIDLAVKLGGLTDALEALNEVVKDRIIAEPKRDPVVAAYLAKKLPNTVRATSGGGLLGVISLDHLVGYVRYRQDRLTVAAIDDLANGLNAMKQAGQGFDDEIDACLKEVPPCRRALAAYEKALAGARDEGEQLAAAIVGRS